MLSVCGTHSLIPVEYLLFLRVSNHTKGDVYVNTGSTESFAGVFTGAKLYFVKKLLKVDFFEYDALVDSCKRPKTIFFDLLMSLNPSPDLQPDQP